MKPLKTIKDDFSHDEGEPLSPNGVVFHNPWVDCYILVITGLSKSIHLPSMKAALQSSLGKQKRFSSILIEDKHGYQKWMPKDFNIDDHVVIPELSSHFRESHDFVEKYTATIATAAPLDPSIPLWQIHVLNYRSEDAEASVVFRIHHSIGDCVSLMSLLLDCTRKNSSLESMPTIPIIHKGKKFPVRNLVDILQAMRTIIFSLCLTVLNFLHAVATFLWMKDSEMVRGPPGVASSTKRLAHVTVDLEDITIVKKAINGTVNDVVTGMLSAGFVQYFNRPHPKDGERSTTPRIRALVPVNLRSEPGLHKLEHMIRNPKEARWGNRFGLWILPISVSKHHEYLEYCRVAKANTKKKKASVEAKLLYSLAALVLRLFGWQAAVELPLKIMLNTTLVFSNVLGPAEQVQFMGNPISHIITTVSGLPQGLVVHFQSYAGKAKLIAMAADDVFPDAQQLCKDCAHALSQMKQEALLLVD